MFSVREFFVHEDYPADYDGGDIVLGSDIAFAVVELDFSLDKKKN